MIKAMNHLIDKWVAYEIKQLTKETDKKTAQMKIEPAETFSFSPRVWTEEEYMKELNEYLLMKHER